MSEPADTAGSTRSGWRASLGRVLADRRAHAAWLLVALVVAIGGWTAYHPIGAAVLVVGLVAATVVALAVGARGAWLGIATGSILLAVLLGWMAVTGSRCPGPDELLVIRENKPGVSCAELRASATTMSAAFGLLALAALAWPAYRRSIPPEDPTIDDGTGFDAGSRADGR